MTDREALSYEQARDELASVVKRLETGGLTLEQSLDLWERGEKLAAICAEWLDGARARLTAAMAAREHRRRTRLTVRSTARFCAVLSHTHAGYPAPGGAF